MNPTEKHPMRYDLQTPNNHQAGRAARGKSARGNRNLAIPFVIAGAILCAGDHSPVLAGSGHQSDSTGPRRWLLLPPCRGSRGGHGYSSGDRCSRRFNGEFGAPALYIGHRKRVGVSTVRQHLVPASIPGDADYVHRGKSA